MRRYIQVLIAVAFLGYGLLRIGVGTGLLGQELGLVDIQAFHGPIHDVTQFLDRSRQRQIISVSVSGYVAYIALMGLVLSIGAFRTLKHPPLGLPLIGAFLAMYALLFVNFQTINPKMFHLGVCTILFAALLILKKPDNMGHRSQI